MFTIDDLLDIAIKMEQNGKALYCRALEKTEDRELCELLSWMAREEGSHEKWFSKQKQNLSEKSKTPESIPTDLLNEMMDGKALSLEEMDFSTILTPVKMLETFMGFENDTILFYEFIEAFIRDPETINGLRQIIHEETLHVEKLGLMISSYDTVE